MANAPLLADPAPRGTQGKVPEADERRPSFARQFPPDAALDELVLAFARGDYARVRSEAPRLVAQTSDPRVAAAARELSQRIAPDPLALLLIALTAALLVFLSAWAWLRGHG
jgi:hypothetical protein